jgi:hypothetical protein
MKKIRKKLGIANRAILCNEVIWSNDIDSVDWSGSLVDESECEECVDGIVHKSCFPSACQSCSEFICHVCGESHKNLECPHPEIKGMSKRKFNEPNISEAMDKFANKEKKIKKFHGWWIEDAQGRLDKDSMKDITHAQWVVFEALRKKIDKIISHINGEE